MYQYMLMSTGLGHQLGQCVSNTKFSEGRIIEHKGDKFVIRQHQPYGDENIAICEKISK